MSLSTHPLRQYAQHKPDCETKHKGLRWEPHYKWEAGRWWGAWVPDQTSDPACTCGLDKALEATLGRDQGEIVSPCDAHKDVRDGDRWETARCGLPAGHLGSHEGMAHGHRWFWNEHAAGIMRDRHPTTNAVLTHRPLLTSAWRDQGEEIDPPSQFAGETQAPHVREG